MIHLQHQKIYLATQKNSSVANYYSIVKDSSADLGVNFKIVQNRPTVKAVCTKISKNFFCIFVNIFVLLRENKEVSSFIFHIEYLSKNSPKLNQNYYWLWVYFGISVSNGQIRITVLNYTVLETHIVSNSDLYFWSLCLIGTRGSYSIY